MFRVTINLVLQGTYSVLEWSLSLLDQSLIGVLQCLSLCLVEDKAQSVEDALH